MYTYTLLLGDHVCIHAYKLLLGAVFFVCYIVCLWIVVYHIFLYVYCGYVKNILALVSQFPVLIAQCTLQSTTWLQLWKDDFHVLYVLRKQERLCIAEIACDLLQCAMCNGTRNCELLYCSCVKYGVVCVGNNGVLPI